jgi:transposase
MIELFSQTCEYEKLQAQPANDFMLARIVAETGSFGNYAVLEKLLKYAGLNLREHTSGTYKGQVRLSKKGNTLLRKILGQVAFSCFIKSGCIYADYYKKKKEKAGGIYGLTCVIRKVLKMLYGICRSDAAYNKERVQCQNVQPLDNAA